MKLNFDCKIENGTAYVSIEHTLDISTVDEFEKNMNNISKVSEIFVSFQKMKFIDSTGIGSLVKVIKHFQENKVSIKIINIPNEIYDILDILGLIDIYKDTVFVI